MNCKKCGRALTFDEKAVYLKMVNRQATEFLCKTCLADYFEVAEILIDKKIEQFKNNGCMLFINRVGGYPLVE